MSDEGTMKVGAKGGAAAATEAAAESERSSRSTFGSVLSKYGLLIFFLLVIAFFSIERPNTFPTWENAESILILAAPAMILALGLTVVLVMQDFDLSFGAMLGLASGALTTFMITDDLNWIIAVLIVLAMGIAAGTASGVMVAYLGGSSFIITLAMGTVLTGVELAFTGSSTLYSGYPEGFTEIAQGEVLGLSNQIWIAALLALVAWAVLDRTEIGRYMYAIGGNREAARLSGIRVRPIRVLGFVIVGVSAVVAGLLLTSVAASYSPGLGGPYLLPAFAACFLGAAVFRPGEFNIPGTIIGVLFLGVIQTGLVMLNFETYVVNLVQGGILIAAVLVSRLGSNA